MCFPMQGMQTRHSGALENWDKIPTKTNYAVQKVWVVPPAVAHYGSFLAPGAIMMSSYVNICA